MLTFPQGLTSYYFALVMKSIGVTSHNEQFEINGSKTILSVRWKGALVSQRLDKLTRL